MISLDIRSYNPMLRIRSNKNNLTRSICRLNKMEKKQAFLVRRIVRCPVRPTLPESCHPRRHRTSRVGAFRRVCAQAATKRTSEHVRVIARQIPCTTAPVQEEPPYTEPEGSLHVPWWEMPSAP